MTIPNVLPAYITIAQFEANDWRPTAPAPKPWARSEVSSVISAHTRRAVGKKGGDARSPTAVVPVGRRCREAAYSVIVAGLWRPARWAG
ncbi:hypothetical protein [Streptomyces avermitilis]|uniref:hypothetical protein n=1 Tax=Streptomyces avermitilis TaxID=33903 RepID=UPI0036AD79A2